MTYSRLRLGDFARVKGGKRLPTGMVVQDEPTSHPYLRVVDFNNDGLDPKNVKFINDEAFSRVNRYIIRDTDVYISIAGTIGRVGVVPKRYSGANLTENAAKITEIAPCFDNRFLMYYLRSHEGQGQIAGLTGGTSQPKLALFRIEEIMVPSPPLPTQRKVATVLSTYDDLIENNTRRIQILEEMARVLYREWFVEFRFPGFEGVKLLETEHGRIPHGWEVVPVTQAVMVNPSTKVIKDGKKPFLPMGCLSNNSMLISDIESREGNSGSKFMNGDTLFARITPCLENGKTGFVQFLPSAEAVAFGSTEFIVLRSRTLCPEYVYLMARSDVFRNNAIKSMSGATGRQRVQEACFNQFKIAHPDSATLNSFHDITAPMFRAVHALALKNENIRRTRDLILPKLVSGEVDISDLDITNPEAIA